MACRSCGGNRKTDRRGTSINEQRPAADPTRALFAAARPNYVVLAHSGMTTGKRFSTLAAAEDYARRTNGIIRPV